MEVGEWGNSPGNSVPDLLRSALRAQELRFERRARCKIWPGPFGLFQSPGAEIGTALTAVILPTVVCGLPRFDPLALKMLENDLLSPTHVSNVLAEIWAAFGKDPIPYRSDVLMRMKDEPRPI